MKCSFTVYRFDPAVDKKGRYQEYTLEAERTDKILDCLNKIRWEQDPTLAYRFSCAHGICGSDAMVINGRIELACQKLVKDFKTGNNFVIEPLPLFSVIKDLIVDMNPFFAKHRHIRPYLITAGKALAEEFLQDAAQQAVIEPALRCILCASCTAACPINRANGEYLGPAALLRAFRYIFDSRDAATDSRLVQIDSPEGVWGCKSMRWCTDVCPKGIPVTKCLGQIKRLVKQRAQGPSREPRP
ncbi:MAG: succinate dehydrogenase iron-sulfur subunit [Desulfobacterales bacterium]|nr:MAG: succinate dehydrogenase iron-sulfur subunit [Desulfobacterales bacterium]